MMMTTTAMMVISTTKNASRNPVLVSDMSSVFCFGVVLLLQDDGGSTNRTSTE
jgi:hypothetical protein